MSISEALIKPDPGTLPGEWSQWGDWSPCTKSCGVGKQVKHKLFFYLSFQIWRHFVDMQVQHMNDYRIRRYIDRGKFVVNLGC